jgi:hypothetical protein
MNLCWICGQPMGVYKTFVIGPMCTINCVSSEPPSHLECANYAVRACPFLCFPQRKRDDTGIEHLKGNVPGLMIERNPGVTALWTTKSYQVFNPHAGGTGTLYRIGPPTHVQWWAKGRIASRAEVNASISSGLPLLEAQCFNARDREELAQRQRAVEALLPAEEALSTEGA